MNTKNTYSFSHEAQNCLDSTKLNEARKRVASSTEAPIESKEKDQVKSSHLQAEQVTAHRSRNREKIKNLNEIEFASFETDRLKPDSHNDTTNMSSNTNMSNHKCKNALNISQPLIYCDSKQSRDKIIINEIDKMFSSIRDHQGSNAKAIGELKWVVSSTKKRSGSWGYSSNKRHVKAKVMDMPYAEDISSIAKRIGIAESDQLFENVLNQDDSVEKVFVRIDDYINKEVSKVMQRSYSADYLNQYAGPRIRIRYIKIPGYQMSPNQTESVTSTTFNEPSAQLEAYYEMPANQPQGWYFWLFILLNSDVLLILILSSSFI